MDIVYDMLDPLPFDDGTVDEILCIHTLEHVDQWRVPYVLKEWHRVLAPDGVAWGRVPDAEAYARMYLNGLESGDLYREARGLDALLGETRSNPHAHVHQAHRAAFSKRTLEEAFLNGGFESIIIQRLRGSDLDLDLLFAAGKVAAPTLHYEAISVPWRDDDDYENRLNRAKEYVLNRSTSHAPAGPVLPTVRTEA